MEDPENLNNSTNMKGPIIAVAIIFSGLLGIWTGRYTKKCLPPMLITDCAPKPAPVKKWYKIEQEIFPLSDARMSMTTTSWYAHKIIYRNHVSERPGSEVYHKGNLWFVPKLTFEVKKAEYEKAERASEEYIEKLRPYKP